VAGKYENTIRTFFQSLYEIDGVDATRAGNPDDLNIFRKLQSQGSCHVRSRISRLIAAKSNDFRVEICHFCVSNDLINIFRLSTEIEIPNYKFQIPNNSKIPTDNDRNGFV
jgi:hypothetical protein